MKINMLKPELLTSSQEYDFILLLIFIYLVYFVINYILKQLD